MWVDAPGSSPRGGSAFRVYRFVQEDIMKGGRGEGGRSVKYLHT